MQSSAALDIKFYLKVPVVKMANIKYGILTLMATQWFLRWKTASIAVQLDWETIFGDFNGDGIIGFPIADASL